MSNTDKKMCNILIVDDERDYRETLAYLFETEGYSCKKASSAEEALEIAQVEYFHIVVTDIMMEGSSGIELLKKLKQQYHDEVEIIMVTGYGSIETAVETIKIGAFGYFIKSHDPEELIKEVEKARLVMEARRAPAIYKNSVSADFVEGSSPRIKKLWGLVKTIAESNANVIITGESGCGKEIIAQQIHNLSSRSNKLFLPINCQSLPSNLIESELFGHEKGAFTGANELRIGKLEQCGGGTVFLDEIGDMDLAIQVKLLRVLENHKIERIGSNKAINVDFRVVSATNKDIKAQVQDGRFREDLWYRINTFEIHVPPLRERREDISEFVDFFIRKNTRDSGKTVNCIDEKTKNFLMEYDYPGNIRELKNIIERLFILTPAGGVLSIDSWHESYEKSISPAVYAADKNYKDAKQDFERDYFRQVLKHADGNITAAARNIGLSRRQLFNKIQELGIKN